MSHLRHTVLAIALVAATIGSWAQTAATGQPSGRQAAPLASMDSQMMEKRMDMMQSMMQMMIDRLPPPAAK